MVTGAAVKEAMAGNGGGFGQLDRPLGGCVPRRALDGHPRRPAQGLPHTVAEITDTVGFWSIRQTSSGWGQGIGVVGTVMREGMAGDGGEFVQLDRPLRERAVAGNWGRFCAGGQTSSGEGG